MSKDNRVSDERLTLIASGIADRLGAGASAAPDLERDIASAITELLSLRSKPVAGVEVKPLGEWRRGYCDERVKIEQQSFGGLYQVRVLDDVVWLDWPNRTAEEFATVQLAKAAAEADYRNRILSALSVSEQEPVAWLHPVAKWAHERREQVQAHCRKDGSDGGPIPLYSSPQPEEITEDMVERAAKALYQEDDVWHEAFPWPDTPPGSSNPDSYRRLARATVTAALQSAKKEG